MTLHEIERSDREYLLASDVAGVLDMDPNSIRFMAHERPDLLGFPTIAYQKSDRSQTWHVKIPRLGFLHYMKYGKAPIAREERTTV